MPSNHTEHYQLNQWNPEDKVLRTDFNADNVKLDAALTGKADVSALAALGQRVDSKADSSALTALSEVVVERSVALAGKGNCQIWTTTYEGTGESGTANARTLTCPNQPLAVLVIGADGSLAVFTPGQTGGYSFSTSGSTLTVTWSGNTVRWYHHQNSGAQMNAYRTTYRVLVFMTA